MPNYPRSKNSPGKTGLLSYHLQRQSNLSILSARTPRTHRTPARSAARGVDGGARGPGPKREKPAGAIPLRASPGACDASFRRGDAAPCARSEKRPPRARRPALPQPFAAVLSAKAGLTAGFGMGPGDPRLCGRARGGRSPAAHDMEPARNPSPGRPWRPHGGHGRRWRIALGAHHRGCEELGPLVPLG